MADKKRYIPLPSLWLDKENTKGFAGTKKWHNNIAAIAYQLRFTNMK